MKWIDAGDIKNWVNGKQRHCAQTLPELVRRLIFATATATSIEEIDFPSGDSVAGGGWDGRLKTSAVSPFFPDGASGWEIGAEKSPGKKAEEDYRKRTGNPLGLKRKETTFVFVTPRRWPGRDQWQGGKRVSAERTSAKRRPAKRASARWKGTRVIAADALELWLDSAPAVSLWLAKQIGKVVSGGIRDLESVWEEWSLATDPSMTPDLVIAGRGRNVEQIHEWLENRPRVLSLQGDSTDEAVAFLYAAVAALPEMSRVRVLSRCVVVESVSELRQLTQAFQNPLIIAAPGECIEAAGAAVVKGHHVILSMDAKLIDIGNVIRLSRPQYSIVETNLRLNGLSQLEAHRLARDFGRSIPVLRRHLYRSSTVSAPIWASPESADVLLPALLAGAWTENKTGDRLVLEALSGLDYDTFTKSLRRFVATEDAPIQIVGNVWMLKSPLDAWFLLARHLDNGYLKRFGQAIAAVLTQTDPKYDLPVDQRWAASIYGKSSPYSAWLRTGLVESLVLLAVYGDRSPSVKSTQGFADAVVRDIFAAAQTWEAWASIKDVTPLLAEASPDTFIDVIDHGIAKTPTLFQELMKDDPGVFGECKHSGLLWALESVAWSSEYFLRAVSALTGLAMIDPGGRWSNRAKNSLREIFLPGFPQTYASPHERLAAFGNIVAKAPKIAWDFAKSYLGQGHFSESRRFRWRDTGGERRGMEPEKNQAYQEYLEGLRPRLGELACKRENLVSSIDGFNRLPADMRERLLTELGKTDPANLSPEERGQLLRAIRQVLNWINSYGDMEQRLNAPALNQALKKFEPQDILQRVSWLLSNPWPRLPEGEPENYEGRDARVDAAQEQAAREVLDNISIQRILVFAATIEHVGVLGRALGRAVKDSEEDATLLDAMIAGAANNPVLITGYALGRIEATDSDWVRKQVERLKPQHNYSPDACALLYLALPEGMDTWSVVSAQGEHVDRAYWKRASGYSRVDLSRDAPFAVEKLVDAKRPAAALEIAGRPNISVPGKLLKRLIQELLSLGQKGSKLQADTMMEFHLGYLFKQLYERAELPIEEIAQLEWPFAALFEGLLRYTSSPLAIHQVLQNDPSFFAELVAFMYKRDDNPPASSPEGVDEGMRENLAHNARLVLDSWRLLPGLNDDGSLNEKRLTEWIEAARVQCAATHHVVGGDLQIGFMLARVPGDADGNWPHVAARNVIEHLDNDLIDQHIQMGVYNGRGVVARGLMDGGAQERALANHYKKMSEAIKLKWPRTAAMLRSLANSYIRDAEHQDISSELNALR